MIFLSPSKNPVSVPLKTSIGRRGFSLIEVMVATGILSVVILGTAQSLHWFTKEVSTIENRDEASEFVVALARYLSSDSSCTAALKGNRFPTSASVAVQNIVIRGYRGFGAEGASDIQAGIKIGRHVRIASLEIANRGVPPQAVISDGLKSNRHMGQIRVNMEIDQVASKKKSLVTRYIEVPVITAVANGVQPILGCNVEMTVGDACTAMGGTLAAGACKPATQCQVKGHYILSTCSPSYSGCLPGTPNTFTHSNSCPAGSVANQSGETSQNIEVQTGKKSSMTVTQTIRFFICMECS